MTFEEKTIKSELIYDGPIFKLYHKTVTGAGGTTFRDIIEHTGGIGIAALTKDGKLLMIRQFRKAAGQVIWEIPAGKTEPYEKGKGLETAKRELREETGYEAENWKLLTSFYVSPGYSSEVLEIYRADATVKGETHFDPSEAIDLYEIEIPKLLEMIKNGEVKDAKTIIAILLVARELGYR